MEYAGQKKVSADINKRIKQEASAQNSNTKKSEFAKIHYYSKLVNKNKLAMKKKIEEPGQTPEYRINGSGLFHFLSELSEAKKLEILDWVDSLTDKQKEFVNTLRQEAIDETNFFSDSNYL